MHSENEPFHWTTGHLSHTLFGQGHFPAVKIIKTIETE